VARADARRAEIAALLPRVAAARDRGAGAAHGGCSGRARGRRRRRRWRWRWQRQSRPTRRGAAYAGHAAALQHHSAVQVRGPTRWRGRAAPHASCLFGRVCFVLALYALVARCRAV
jgi:hypothetical protein